MSKPAWSWADYERCKRREERRAAKPAAKTSVKAQEVPTADDASGCEGRAPEGSSGPAPVKVAALPLVAVKARQSRKPMTAGMKLPPVMPVLHPEMKRAIEYDARNRGAPSPFDPSRRIDISTAPSGMEASAERWKGKGPAPMEAAPVPVLCAGMVMCRCGSRASGKGRGPVPSWFGEKCIEANCELRGERRG